MIKGVLLDLSGVIYIENALIDGAMDAVQRLAENNVSVRYITNTTRSTRSSIVEKLAAMNFNILEKELFTAPIAAKNHIVESNLNPYLLIHPNLLTEFSEFAHSDFDSVLLGDAGNGFTYEALNKAFRIIIEGAPLFAMGDNRYFKESDGLSLDAGAFVHALEYSAGVKATILGKPAKEFFLQAIKDFNCSADQVVMVGDDVEADVLGSISAGLQSILVQTGKYRSTDDELLENSPARIANNIVEAVDIILS